MRKTALFRFIPIHKATHLELGIGNWCPVKGKPNPGGKVRILAGFLVYDGHSRQDHFEEELTSTCRREMDGIHLSLLK